MDTNPDPLPNIPGGNSEQRGGPGGAAVPYAVIGDASMVAKRRVGVVANVATPVEYRDVKQVMVDTKQLDGETNLKPRQSTCKDFCEQGDRPHPYMVFDHAPPPFPSDINDILVLGYYCAAVDLTRSDMGLTWT